MRLFRKRKTVLVLGGGAARGLSNLGVLKVMERHFGRDNMPFDMMVGTSIGSLIGAAYCAGTPIDELEEEAVKFGWPTLLDLGFHPTGFIKGDKLENIITEMIRNKGFDDLRIPFAVTTTDIETGQELVHTSGDLIRLVRASCSWPGFFSSVRIDGRLLADGGLRNTIPTKAAYGFGATFVIAVNPGFAVKNQKIDNALKALLQSFQIMGDELNAYQARAADVVIKPVLKDIDQFDFDKAAFIIQQGETAAEKQVKKIKRRLIFRL